MCGGTSSTPSDSATPQGLSPRVRGNRCHCGKRIVWNGSIPACAGEPLMVSRSHSASRVYPRVCGGTGCPPDSGINRLGLSPRVRGNLSGTSLGRSSRGSIPACAGEPSLQPASLCSPGVYPRVCGGTSATFSRTFFWAGLSPRVRGNLPKYSPSHLYIGSIPACAGEPCAPPWFPSLGGVYPRVCGGTCARIW